MSGTAKNAAGTAVTKRYEALFRVSQTLISVRSSEELFSILARELRAVVGSIEADAYSQEELGFLSLVANQLVLAVDDAMNFGALQHANKALRASEESFRLIVDSIPALFMLRRQKASSIRRYLWTPMIFPIRLALQRTTTHCLDLW
jgi:hypothetical protein